MIAAASYAGDSVDERGEHHPVPPGRPEGAGPDPREWLSCLPTALFFQPIFYPVLNEEYAAGIARDWNTKDEASGYVGYVTRFRVRTEYLRKYEIHTVGSSIHKEYWIPAEDLPEFNDNIIGVVEVVAEFRPAQDGGDEMSGRIPRLLRKPGGLPAKARRDRRVDGPPQSSAIQPLRAGRGIPWVLPPDDS